MNGISSTVHAPRSLRLRVELGVPRAWPGRYRTQRTCRRPQRQPPSGATDLTSVRMKPAAQGWANLKRHQPHITLLPGEPLKATNDTVAVQAFEDPTTPTRHPCVPASSSQHRGATQETELSHISKSPSFADERLESSPLPAGVLAKVKDSSKRAKRYMSFEDEDADSSTRAMDSLEKPVHVRPRCGLRCASGVCAIAMGSASLAVLAAPTVSSSTHISPPPWYPHSPPSVPPMTPSPQPPGAPPNHPPKSPRGPLPPFLPLPSLPPLPMPPPPMPGPPHQSQVQLFRFEARSSNRSGTDTLQNPLGSASAIDDDLATTFVDSDHWSRAWLSVRVNSTVPISHVAVVNTPSTWYDSQSWLSPFEVIVGDEPFVGQGLTFGSSSPSASGAGLCGGGPIYVGSGGGPFIVPCDGLIGEWVTFKLAPRSQLAYERRYLVLSELYVFAYPPPPLPPIAPPLPPSPPTLPAPSPPPPVLPFPGNPPLPPAIPSLARIQSAFDDEGLLVHMIDMRDFACDNCEDFHREARWFHELIHGGPGAPGDGTGPQDKTSTARVYDLPIDADCGSNCHATTLLSPHLPVSVFSSHNYKLGGAFVYDARPIWNYSQCASVVDSNSANRACCACQDQRWYNHACPFGNFPQSDAGYCETACHNSSDATCKQLKAGCGVNLWEVRFFCNREEILNQECHQCGVPDWCSEDGNPWTEYYKAQTPRQWLSKFAGQAPGIRQCKWKPSQKQTFVEAARLYYSHNQRHPDQSVALENEVNFYVGEGDDGASRALMDSLIGLVIFRTTAVDDDLASLRLLRDKFLQLGKALPIFALTNERPGEHGHWNYDVPITNLEQSPYQLELVDGLKSDAAALAEQNAPRSNQDQT